MPPSSFGIVVELGCPKCGNAWEVWGSLGEGGCWLPEDDADLFCPRCGRDNGEGGERDG